jgi:hypothetical protein
VLIELLKIAQKREMFKNVDFKATMAELIGKDIFHRGTDFPTNRILHRSSMSFETAVALCGFYFNVSGCDEHPRGTKFQEKYDRQLGDGSPWTTTYDPQEVPRTPSLASNAYTAMPHSHQGHPPSPWSHNYGHYGHPSMGGHNNGQHGLFSPTGHPNITATAPSGAPPPDTTATPDVAGGPPGTAPTSYASSASAQQGTAPTSYASSASAQQGCHTNSFFSPDAKQGGGFSVGTTTPRRSSKNIEPSVSYAEQVQAFNEELEKKLGRDLQGDTTMDHTG